MPGGKIVLHSLESECQKNLNSCEFLCQSGFLNVAAGTSADFTKPFISQMKVSGGGPIPGVGSQNTLASFSSMTFKAKKVRSFPSLTHHYHTAIAACSILQVLHSAPVRHLSKPYSRHIWDVLVNRQRTAWMGAARWLTLSACALQPRTCKNAFRATMIFHNSRHPKSLARMLNGNVVARSPTRGNDGI